MKKYYFYFLLLLSGCCRERDSVGVQILEEIHLDHLFEPPGKDCYQLPGTYCIRDDSTFKALFKTKTASGCDSISLPSIDFSRYSVLLYYRQDGGRVFYDKQVALDTIDKELTYTIRISGNCFCPDKCMRQDYNLVMVNKVPLNYTVVYE